MESFRQANAADSMRVVCSSLAYFVQGSQHLPSSKTVVPDQIPIACIWETQDLDGQRRAVLGPHRTSRHRRNH